MSWPCLLLALYLQPLWAQEILAPISVTATKEVSDFSFGSSTSLSTQTLETEPSSLVSTNLNKVPGITAVQDGGPGARATFFFRGTESRHVAFTLDGLKLNDPSNNDRQFDAAFFTSPMLQELDVHKGPQSVLFGSDALGGLVELRSRKGENANQTRFNVNGGSFGTFGSSLSHDWKNSKNRGTLTLTKFKTDGLSRLNKKRFNAKELDSADITQLSSSSEHRWAGSVQTDLLFTFLRGKNELDGFVDDNSYDHSENDQYLLQQKTHYEFNPASAISYRTGLNRHQRRISTLYAGHESYEGNLVQNEILYRHSFGDLNLLSGVTTDHEELNVETVEKSFDIHSVFLQGAFDLKPFKLQLGVRADRHTRYGVFTSNTEGISYEQAAHTFSLQHSLGYKAPSLYQLYALPLSGRPIANPNLEPESNNALELLWNRKGSRIDTQISLFQNHLSHLITFTNQGFKNQSGFIAEGIEAGLIYKHAYFLVKPFFVHQQFIDTESTVLRRPYNTFELDVSLFPADKWILGTRFNQQAARKDFDPNGKIVKLNPYQTVDLYLKYVLEKHDFGVQLTNLFDRVYENAYGFSVIPRSIFFSYGMKI